jgi:tetratricopeptide (TPR) repeat protein
MELDDSIHDDITDLCEQGDAFAADGDYRGALPLYHQAWELLPEPKEDWDAATWLLSAIGDAHFGLGEFQEVIAALQTALQCPDGLGNPFIHLRLGEALFEIGNQDRAGDELTRAYMAAGREIFGEEDPKYFTFLRSILQPSPEEEDL